MRMTRGLAALFIFSSTTLRTTGLCGPTAVRQTLVFHPASMNEASFVFWTKPC